MDCSVDEDVVEHMDSEEVQQEQPEVPLEMSQIHWIQVLPLEREREHIYLLEEKEYAGMPLVAMSLAEYFPLKVVVVVEN